MPDILTPHTGEWLAEGGDGNVAPADYHTPVPTKFLVAKKWSSCSVLFVPLMSILPRIINTASLMRRRRVTESMYRCLSLVWRWCKNVVGYGTFSQTQNEALLTFDTQELDAKYQAESGESCSSIDGIHKLVAEVAPQPVEKPDVSESLTKEEFDTLFDKIEIIIASSKRDKNYREGIVTLLDDGAMARLTSEHCIII